MKRLLLILVLTACGGGEGVLDPPPTEDAKVILLEATVGQNGTNDAVYVHLRNDGGAGTFYLEFWGEPSGSPSNPHPAQQRITGTPDVTINSAYNEIIVHQVPPVISSVKVFTRALGSAARQTDCAKVRDFGVC